MNYIKIYPLSFLAYVTIVLLSTLLAHVADHSKKYSKLALTANVILLAGFCGMRGTEVGTDTKHYLYMISQLKNGSFDSVWGENGFKYILLSCSKIPIQNFALIFCALLSVYFIIIRLWELREKFDFTIAVFIYCTYFYYQNFNIVRQCLAMAILFWATRYLEKKEIKKFYVILLLCMFIHSTAIVGLLFVVYYIHYFEREGITSKKVAMWLGLIAISILIYTSQSRAQHLFEKYGSLSNSAPIAMPLFRLLLICLFEFFGLSRRFLNKPEIKKEQISENKFVKLTYLSGTVLGIIIAFFAPENADRIALYFRQYEMLYYGSKAENLSLQSLKRIVIVLFAAMSFYLTMAAGRYGIMPYHIFNYG